MAFVRRPARSSAPKYLCASSVSLVATSHARPACARKRQRRCSTNTGPAAHLSSRRKPRSSNPSGAAFLGALDLELFRGANPPGGRADRRHPLILGRSSGQTLLQAARPCRSHLRRRGRSSCRSAPIRRILAGFQFSISKRRRSLGLGAPVANGVDACRTSSRIAEPVQVAVKQVGVGSARKGATFLFREARGGRRAVYPGGCRNGRPDPCRR